MNVNRQCTDDSADELHKMISQMHQMMSQEQQMVGTTPGQSQQLLMTPETINLTEIIDTHIKGTTGDSMTQIILLCVPC